MFEARRAPRRKPAIHSPVVKVSTNWDVFAEMRWLGKQWTAWDLRGAALWRWAWSKPSQAPRSSRSWQQRCSSRARAQSIKRIS